MAEEEFGAEESEKAYLVGDEEEPLSTGIFHSQNGHECSILFGGSPRGLSQAEDLPGLRIPHHPDCANTYSTITNCSGDPGMRLALLILLSLLGQRSWVEAMTEL